MIKGSARSPHSVLLTSWVYGLVAYCLLYPLCSRVAALEENSLSSSLSFQSQTVFLSSSRAQLSY